MSNPYCDLSTLNRLFDARVLGMLSNDTDSTSADNVTIQLHLDIAASEIDSILSGRVSLPLAYPPAFLSEFTAAKAMFTLYERRGDVPNDVRSRAARSDRWLQAFEQGKVALPNASREAPAMISSSSSTGASITDNILYYPGTEKLCE